MVDMDAISQSIAEHRAALAETATVNKKMIFDALAANGFTHVSVTFDGESDSGQIDNPSGYVSDVLTTIPEQKVTLNQASWSDSQITTSESSLPAAIVALYFGLTIGGAAFAAAELTFALCDSCSWPSAAFMSLLAGWAV